MTIFFRIHPYFKCLLTLFPIHCCFVQEYAWDICVSFALSLSLCVFLPLISSRFGCSFYARFDNVSLNFLFTYIRIYHKYKKWIQRYNRLQPLRCCCRHHIRSVRDSVWDGVGMCVSKPHIHRHVEANISFRYMCIGGTVERAHSSVCDPRKKATITLEIVQKSCHFRATNRQ